MDDDEKLRELERLAIARSPRPPLDAILRLHHVVAEATYSGDDGEYLIATDLGLLRVWYRHQDSPDAVDPLPSADSEMTAWRDVRDIELSGRVVQMSTTDLHNPYGHTTDLHLVVQVPRVDVTAGNRERCQALMALASAMIRHYNASE